MVLQPSCAAQGCVHDESSDMDSENKKLAAWAPLVKFILGKNVKGTGRKIRADLVFFQHLPSKRQ